MPIALRLVVSDADIQDRKSELTRQLVTSQSKGITCDLLVYQASELKDNLIDCHSCCPMVEGALSLAHTYLSKRIWLVESPPSVCRQDGTYFVTADKHAYVAAHSLIESELLPSQPLLDGVFSDLELLRADSPVVIGHPQPVISPHDGCTLDGPAGRNSCASLHHLLSSIEARF
jgi:hypothetical protein